MDQILTDQLTVVYDGGCRAKSVGFQIPVAPEPYFYILFGKSEVQRNVPVG
jgi:hypothetical protein